MPDFSDPIEPAVSCGSETPTSPTACQQDTTSAVGAACPIEPEMDPLQTTAIPCGTQLFGCTNRTALNYNPRATDDDGSCVFLQPPTISYANRSLPVGNPILIEPVIGGDAYQTISVSSLTPIPSWLVFERATGKFSGTSPSSFSTFTLSVTISNQAGSNTSSFTVTPIFPVVVPGCTNPKAANYNPLANLDNGTCQIFGCRNPLADNYDPQANQDGFCIFYGCTAPTALNYDPEANTDDGSCVFCNPPSVEITGFTWESASQIELKGRAFYATNVNTALNGGFQKTISVVNNAWTAAYDPCLLKNLQVGSSIVAQATATTSCGASTSSRTEQKPPPPPCNCEDQNLFNTEADCLEAALTLYGSCGICEESVPCGVSACGDIYPPCWAPRKQTCEEMGYLSNRLDCVGGDPVPVPMCLGQTTCYDCQCVGNFNCWQVVSVSPIRVINSGACARLSGTPTINFTPGSSGQSALTTARNRVDMTLTRSLALCPSMYPQAANFCASRAFAQDLWTPPMASASVVSAGSNQAIVTVSLEDCAYPPADHAVDIVLKKVCCV